MTANVKRKQQCRYSIMVMEDIKEIDKRVICNGSSWVPVVVVLDGVGVNGVVALLRFRREGTGEGGGLFF